MKENRVSIYNKDKTLRYQSTYEFDMFRELVYLTLIIKTDKKYERE